MTDDLYIGTVICLWLEGLMLPNLRGSILGQNCTLIKADRLLTHDTLNAPWLLTDNSNGLVMVIHNYHWLNSASWVLISTCSAPLVQTGELKQFSLFDLDLWPTTLTHSSMLAKIKVDPHAKNQGQRSNGSNRRVPTVNGHSRTHTEAIISTPTRWIKNCKKTTTHPS